MNVVEISKFELGQIVATPGALAATTEDWRLACLRRHAQGDWGDLCDEDREANEQALADDARLMSVYPAAEGSGAQIWIITEADRAITTLLTPDEY